MAAKFSIIIFFSSTLFISTSDGFLLEGLGLGMGGQRQCCCQPPPPPPCGGGGGYEAPPPPPPMPSYATGSYRNKRSNKNLEASSEDLFCNSVEVRDMIKQGMNDDEKGSRETISMLLKQQIETEYVVICSKIHFDFTASAHSEFCSVTNSAGLTCSAFIF